MRTTADPYNFEIMVEQLLPEIKSVILDNIQRVQPIIEEVIDNYDTDYRLPKIYVNAVARMLIKEFDTLTHEDERLAVKMYNKMRGT